jgi:hypothetical protein
MEVVETRDANPTIAVLSAISHVEHILGVGLHELGKTKFAVIMVVLITGGFVLAAIQPDSL